MWMVHWQCILQMGCVLLFVKRAVLFFSDKAVLMPLASVTTSSGKTWRTVLTKNCSKIHHLSAMQRQQNLTLSYLQHSKFFAVKEQVLTQTNHLHQDDTFNQEQDCYFAIPLNADFAFLHIFKNRGTTVKQQQWKLKKKYLSRTNLGHWQLVAVVQDPLDHFWVDGRNVENVYRINWCHTKVLTWMP